MPDSNRDEIEKLEKLYAANPAGRVFTHLAEAYRKAGDLDRSSELLEAGLLQHPDYPSAYVVLGRVKADRGEADAAGAAFRRVLELDRHNLIAIRALGDLAVEAGRFDEARHYLGELIQIDPADLETADRLEQLPDETVTGFDEASTDPDIAAEGAWGDVSIVDGGGRAGLDASARTPDSGASEAATELEAEAPNEPVMGEVAAPGTDEPAGGFAPLDAWVESLHVVDPETPLSEPPGLMAEEPEFEEVLEADSVETEGDRVILEAFESADGSGTHWDVDLGETDFVDAGGPGVASADALPGFVAGDDDALMDLEATEPDVEPESDPGDWPETNPEAESEFAVEPEPVTELESAAEAVDPAGVESEPGEALSAADAGRPDSETVWWGDPEIHAKVPDPVEWVSQEDWERIAAYGAWTGSGAPEGEVESVPQAETEWGDADRDEDADEVATETLAEVYAAQGFRAEAAEIYRKLLRRRPEDPRLLSRLSALETERAEPAREEAGFEAVEEEGAAAAGQAWLEKIESTWPGGEEPAVAGPTPYAWMESGATEPEAGETIGDRLRGLLAWRPESDPAPEPELELEPTLLLEDVADDAHLPDIPTFGTVAAGSGAGAQGGADPESEDLEMFRSWLKSLRK